MFLISVYVSLFFLAGSGYLLVLTPQDPTGYLGLLMGAFFAFLSWYHFQIMRKRKNVDKLLVFLTAAAVFIPENNAWPQSKLKAFFKLLEQQSILSNQWSSFSKVVGDNGINVFLSSPFFSAQRPKVESKHIEALMNLFSKEQQETIKKTVDEVESMSTIEALNIVRNP